MHLDAFCMSQKSVHNFARANDIISASFLFVNQKVNVYLRRIPETQSSNHQRRGTIRSMPRTNQRYASSYSCALHTLHPLTRKCRQFARCTAGHYAAREPPMRNATTT